MDIVVHRWPVLEDSGGPMESRKVRRTRAPLRDVVCIGEIGPRGLVFVRFPGLQGSYDFRLSTGMPTVDTMLDYVISPGSLAELRRVAEDKKLQEKQRAARHAR